MEKNLDTELFPMLMAGRAASASPSGASDIQFIEEEEEEEERAQNAGLNDDDVPGGTDDEDGPGDAQVQQQPAQAAVSK